MCAAARPRPTRRPLPPTPSPPPAGCGARRKGWRSARSVPSAVSMCARRACSVAVHVPAQRICWLKTATEAAGGRRPREGRTTIVPRTLGAAAAPIEVAATVPGDALTDLQRAGLLSDPLYENTFVTNTSLWQLRWWRYSRRFVLDGAADADASLVLDGVKMGARVSSTAGG